MHFGPRARYSSPYRLREVPKVERRKHRRVPIHIQGLLLGNSHEVEGQLGWGAEPVDRELPPDELDDLEDLINEFDETENSGHA